jgi:hypothetical protein
LYLILFCCSDFLRRSSLTNPAELQGFSISPIEFDKDCDDQMRVVAAVSNQRA